MSTFNIPPVRYFVGNQEVPPPAPPTQLDRIETLLTQIRDALVQRAAPYDYITTLARAEEARTMERFDGPTMGATAARPDLPAESDEVRASAAAPSPLMAMLSAPLPGKAGPDSLYPDPLETPGWLNADVTQENIMQTIGVVGWTATIRPSAAEMGAMKAAYCKAHGIPDPTKGEWDHFVSLELGGHPRDPRNLWWQRYEDATHDIGAHCKDRVENALKRQIVAGQITLAEGQDLIRTDWYACYLKLNKLGMLPMQMTFDPSGDADPDDNA